MRLWRIKLYNIQPKSSSSSYYYQESWHNSVIKTSRPNNKYSGEGDDVMTRLERVFKSQYVTNQAQNIVRYFVNINQNGFVFCDYNEIARSTDLTRRTVIRYVRELKKKELIYVHKCTPYPNVYELTF